MKATKAYIAGLGTSGVLIASFLLLLAVVSAIVAFRGFPGGAENEGLEQLEVHFGPGAADLGDLGRLSPAEGPRRAPDAPALARRGGEGAVPALRG
ncbi:MAG: hypothetical protein ACRDL0_23390, partial [Thermoleophilaceae bacterium]